MITRILNSIAATACITLLFCAQALPAEDETLKTDWREEYAYTLGTQAYIFGYPWVYLAQIRYAWVTQPRNPDTTPYAPLNYFWHIKELADATYRDGGSPNQDTLYSIAWVDLRVIRTWATVSSRSRLPTCLRTISLSSVKTPPAARRGTSPSSALIGKELFRRVSKRFRHRPRPWF